MTVASANLKTLFGYNRPEEDPLFISTVSLAVSYAIAVGATLTLRGGAVEDVSVNQFQNCIRTQSGTASAIWSKFFFGWFSFLDGHILQLCML